MEPMRTRIRSGAKRRRGPCLAPDARRQQANFSKCSTLRPQSILHDPDLDPDGGTTTPTRVGMARGDLGWLAIARPQRTANFVDHGARSHQKVRARKRTLRQLLDEL